MKKANTPFLKNAFSVLFWGSVFFTLKAQAPVIQWQNTIGGSSYDDCSLVVQATDGGYFLGGASQSNISGDKTENGLGGGDYWVIKLDAVGNILWQNTIGGSGTDEMTCLQKTWDGGCIVGGYSRSPISGDKTEGSLNFSEDYWVVKLNATGAIVWQNTIGGSESDRLYAIEQTSDYGYILGGSSNSPASGDKTESSLSGDYWVVKLDVVGNILWQNTIGGSEVENFADVQQTSDGGYLVGGSSFSGISGDKTESSLGSSDYWVVKLNSSGSIVWQNTIGGSDQEVLGAARPTSDGGYILGGYSSSNISADKTENSMGATDFWVVKLNSTGGIVWQNTIGGSNVDNLYDITQASDGGYILSGNSYSGISGDKTEANRGTTDYWVMKLNTSGGIVWQRTIGGNADDDGFPSIRQTFDGGFIIGGTSNSGISGEKTEAPQGGYDAWVVKLAGPPPPVYCSSTSNYPWHEWISRVKIGDLDNISGKSAYSDFTSKSLNLQQGTSKAWEFTVGYSYFTYDEYIRVWIDKNKNGFFEPTETVFESKISRPPDGTPTAQGGYCCMPANFDEPLVQGMRMRVAMKRGGYPEPCETLPFGEVEDYTVNIVAAPVKPDLLLPAWEVIPTDYSACYTLPGAVPFLVNDGVVLNASPMAAAGPFKMKAWLSRGGNDILWKTAQFSGLDANQQGNYTGSFGVGALPLPATLPAGRYSVTIKVDADNEVDELNETNNTISGGSVQVGAPDFVVQNLAGNPASIVPGGNFNLNFLVKNTAIFPLGDLTGGFGATVYLSTDNILQTTTDLVVGTANLTYAQFDAAGLASATAPVSIPAGTATGNYFLFVRENAPCETDAQNNASAPVPIQIGGSQPCSISVQVSNISCIDVPSYLNCTVLVTAVNGGPSGWVAAVGTPSGPVYTHGQYGVPQAVSFYKDMFSVNALVNFYDPAVQNCTANLDIHCPGPPQTCTGNLLQNPGFESGLTGWEGVGEISTSANSGSNALKVCQNGQNIRQTRQATAGKTYDFSVFIKKDATANGVVQLKFMNTSWTPILQEYIPMSTTPGYEQVSRTKTAPAGTAWVEVSLTNYYSSGCVYADDWCLTESGGSPGLQPDLQLANLNFANPSVSAGQVLSYNFDLKNTGTGNAAGNFNIKAWISTDNVLSANDIQDGIVPTGNLTAGQTVPQVFGATTVPGNLAAGQYFLLLKVDADGQISESNENNNLLVSATKFTVTPGSGGSGADLELTMTADKATAPIYSNIVYTFTVKNTGNQTVTNAVIGIEVCPRTTHWLFYNITGLVYAATPGQPTLGSYNIVDQLWTVKNLAPGQTGKLTFTLFTLTQAERKVVAFCKSQSPADPDSQPNPAAPANCTPAQDDEAVWIINAGQTIDNPDNRSLPKSWDETPDFQLFPNPAGEQVFIDLNKWDGRAATISMFNQLGVLVFEKKLDKIGLEPEALDLSETMNGAYFLRIETPGQRPFYGKLMVSRTY